MASRVRSATLVVHQGTVMGPQLWNLLFQQTAYAIKETEELEEWKKYESAYVHRQLG